MVKPGPLPPDYCTTSSRPDSLSAIPARSEGGVVVFVYENRRCLFPRPLLYNDAVALVRDYLLPFDQSKSEVRFLARLPHILEDDDIEIMPPAWAEVCKEINKFHITIIEKPQQDTSPPQAGASFSPPVSLLIPNPNPPAPLLEPPMPPVRSPPSMTVRVTNLHGAHLCTFSTSPDESIPSIRAMIEEKIYIPVTQQTILYGDKVLTRPLDARFECFYPERLSAHGFRDGDTLRLCRKLKLCDKCSCGPGSKEEVEEEREVERVREELKQQESLQKQRNQDNYFLREAERMQDEARRELERRRGSNGEE